MVGELDFPSSEIFYYQQQFTFPVDTSMNVEIITNKKALSTVRNKKKELKDLDNHAWESGDETSTSVAEALDSVNELETELGQSKEAMYKLSYVVRVTAPDEEELKRRCNAVRDFYDDMNVKLVRPVGDMIGLHYEFIPASKRYMNDYIQYVTSDFLAGLGFGAAQMLGEKDGIYLAYGVDTGRNVYLQPALASQGVKGSVTNALSAAFLGSLGGGKSFANNLLVYYAVLYGARALIVDPKAERGNWKRDFPEIADEINIVNLTSDEDNRGMLDPYVIMRRPKDAESLAIDILTFLTGISSRDGERFPILRRAVRTVTNSKQRGLPCVIEELRKEDSTAATAIADHIESFTDYDFAHLLFSAGDVIPAELDFEDGSVQVDGVTTEYSFDSETATLTVPLGELTPNTTKTVTFAATVNESAYGKTVYNTAVMSGDNIPDTGGTDDGVSVGDGKARPSIEKTADKSSAKVGDKITYTLTLSNSETATVPVEDAVVTDVLPAGLTFEYGSVMLDGSGTSDFTYDENTRLLTVNVGSIAPDTSRTVTFVVTVNADAYNTTIQNLATLTSGNTEPVQDKDNGVVVADGMTDLSIEKSVSTATAKVGDTLTYTVEVSNGAGAEVNIRDAKLTDEIPDGLTFRGNITVDGYSAAYQYDNENRTLSVPLDAIAPGQRKTISFDVLVNSDAYGMTIENTAIASGSNTPNAEDTDDGVTIEDGTPDGHAGAKSANKTTTHVGDTITYTITLQNGATATADWTGATVTDVLPDGVTFAGNVQKDGQATTEYSYDSSSRTLMLTPYAIAPDTQVVYTFDVTVDEGMQGEFIINTAILTDGNSQTPLPDAGVQIDEGEADPIVNKTASVTEADVGDTFSYTITVKNSDKATAPWRNVVVNDTLPAGVKLIGNVYLDGKVALHKLNGNALSVMVGDLAAGESVTVSFDVQVLDTAAGTILQNSVDVTGDNGSGTATDGGVTVPEVEPQNPTNPTGFYVTKDVDKTVVNVSKDVSNGLKTVTFTIVVGNNSSETWTNVVLKDMLDTSMLTPILQNNVYVDGVLNNDWSFAGKVFSLELGDIEPSQFRTVVLAVQFKADAGGMTYVNYATGEGDNGNATGKSPEIEIVSVVDDPITDIHYQLYNGYGENMWRPGDRISLQEACTVAYRLISNGGNTWLERGTVTVPDYEFSIPEEAKYFVSIGVLPASVFDTTKMTEDVDYEINYEVSENGYLRIWSTSDQLNTLVKYITGTNAGLSGNVSRLNFAKLICQLTGRDTDPDTSGYSGHIQHYTDSGSSESLITEVSHEHDYMLDADGNEYWI